MLLTSSYLIDFLLLISTTIFLLHKYLSRNYDYWKKRGIFYIKPLPFFGNIFDIVTFKLSIGAWQKQLYESTEKPYIGIFVFDKPTLVLRSPELIKNVLTGDFNHFSNRTILTPQHNQVVSHLIFFSKDEEWRIMRRKMTPAFTSGKLKVMFPVIKDVAHEMCQYIKDSKNQLEAKKLATKFSIEVISRTAFGVKAFCFEEDDAEFLKIGRRFFNFSWRNAICQNAYMFMQNLASFLHLEFVDKSSIEYLKNLLKANINERETNNIKRNDIIDMVIELKKNKQFCENFKFEGDKILAAPFQFFAAGTETTSLILSFTLYQLCFNPEIQNKLRQEILNNTKNEDLSYDSINNMKYLEMCILETLRMYPVLPFLDRQCTQDWTIPGTDTVIDKKASIYIPLAGLHHDENYFPEPQKYNPERFIDKAIYNQNGLYYLPFGDGPRICIGERLAMISVKVGLIFILSHFKVEPTPDTPICLDLSPSFISQPKGDLSMQYVDYHPEPKPENC